MTDLVAVDDAELTAITARGAGVLRSNGLVVAPAGTMYGLYASVVSEAATARVFAAREAPRTAPLPVVVHNPRQLPNFVGHLSDAAERLIASYWPGPLTLIFRLLPGLGWHLGESAGYVALRMPSEPIALMLVSKVGPLACAAATRAGGPSPTTAAMARQSLGDDVDLYLDDGSREGEPSTIVDVSRGGAEVLRPGAVPAHHVAAVAGGTVELGGRPVDPPADPDEEPSADAPQEPSAGEASETAASKELPDTE